MTDDEDLLTAPVPEPDAEPTAAERAHAKAFGDLVDKTLVSGRMPPAMSADDRALLEVATVIRAASGGMELAASRRQSMIEDVLRQAVGGHLISAATSVASVAPIIPIRRRWLPWTIASASSMVAAAAIVLLVVGKPAAPVSMPTAAIPLSWKSRPADPLIGRIDNECTGKAAIASPGFAGVRSDAQRRADVIDCAREATVRTSSRIDNIFADRLEGYRERRFARRGGKP